MYEQAIDRLIQSNSVVQGRLQSYLTPFNLTIQQFNILRILNSLPAPVSVCEIRQRMMYKMSDTSRLVKRLSEKGLLKRQSCCNDKRLLDIALTDDGQTLIKRVEQNFSSYATDLFAKLSDDECRLLCRLLDKVAK